MSLTEWQGIVEGLQSYWPDDDPPETQQHLDTPLDVARAIDPGTIRTPALELINRYLVELLATPDGRLILCMPPQEGKTTLIRRFIEWVLRDSPDTRVAVATNTQDLAREMGGAVKDDIDDHRAVLNLRLRHDVASRSQFKILGRRGGVYAVGIGGSLTGRAVDLLVIDDPVKSAEQADSEVYRQRTFDWWQTVAATRLAPGAPVVVVMTRWHEDDLAGRLQAGEDADRWKVLSIPALADHNPDKGETDPLGRQPGEFMASARVNERTRLPRSDAQWRAVKVQQGSRHWTAMYQQRPSPAEGNILKRAWWQRYHTPLWLEEGGSRYVVDRDVEVIQSWDLAFKDTKTSDYVCGQVWMRRGVEAFLLDQVHGRFDFVATCTEIVKLSQKWPQAAAKIVEDKANGPAVIAALQQKVGGLIPEEPTGSKVARASAVSPFIEAGNVWIPNDVLAPWADGFIEESAGFPNAAHDDRVDAMTQALNRLLVMPFQSGQIVTAEEVFDELADFAGYIPRI